MDNDYIFGLKPNFGVIKRNLLNKNNNKNYNIKLCSELYNSFEKFGICFKNHFAFINLCDFDLYKNFNADNKYEEFYYNVAKSGVGLIVNGGIDLNLNNKVVFDKHKHFVNNIHTFGSKIFMQLKCEMGRGINDYINYSSSFNYNINNSNIPCLRISDGKCNSIIDEFVKKTEASIVCGYDGILINANMFNIVGELLSTEFNRRKFGYYNKFNDFSTKLLSKLNRYKNLPIYYSITIDTFLHEILKNDVYNIKTTAKIKKNCEFYRLTNYLIELIKQGVDGFVFCFGTYETEFMSNCNSFMNKNIYSEYLDEICKVISSQNIKNKFNDNISIILNNNFSVCDTIKPKIENNIFDFIDVTKNIYADNNWLNKIKNNIDYMPCINCCYCNNVAHDKNKIECIINPNTLRNYLPLADSSKNVCVVGAGLSGILTAIHLAKKGYTIHLYEKSCIFNNKLKLTEIFGFNKDIKLLNLYLENTINYYIKNNNIKLLLNNKYNYNIDVEYDAIIIATGSHEVNKNINGIVLKNAKNIYDLLKNSQIIENNTKFCILAESELSLKLALYLLSINKKVDILIEKNSEIFSIPNALFTYYFYQFKELSASVYFESKIKENNIDFIEFITNGNLINRSCLANALNLKSAIKYPFEPRLISKDIDIFIYEPNLKENNKLFYDIISAGFNGEVFMVGNALKISPIDEVVKSAYFVAKNL